MSAQSSEVRVSPMRPRTLLVDLCGTLYRSNTTFDFLRFLLADDADYRRFEESSKTLPARLANRLLVGDRRRTRAIGFLDGYSRSFLTEAADSFLDSIDMIEDVYERVTLLRPEHDQTILMSSSIDFIVERACARLGFDRYYASRLNYTGDVCDGTIAFDLLGRKHHVIAAEFADSECTLVTDNRSDVDCRHFVDRFIGVASAADRGGVRYWGRRADEVVAYRS